MQEIPDTLARTRKCPVSYLCPLLCAVLLPFNDFYVQLLLHKMYRKQSLISFLTSSRERVLGEAWGKIRRKRTNCIQKHNNCFMAKQSDSCDGGRKDSIENNTYRKQISGVIVLCMADNYSSTSLHKPFVLFLFSVQHLLL